MAEDIILLGLDSRNDTTQKSSIVMITADIAETANITANAIILDDAGIATNSYT